MGGIQTVQFLKIIKESACSLFGPGRRDETKDFTRAGDCSHTIKSISSLFIILNLLDFAFCMGASLFDALFLVSLPLNII